MTLRVPINLASSAAISAIQAAASAAAAVASAAAIMPPFVSVFASQEITAPGRYVVRTAGVTLTLPDGGVGGDVMIKDATGAFDPAISLAGVFDGVSGLSITLPNSSLTLAWDSYASTYVVFA